MGTSPQGTVNITIKAVLQLKLNFHLLLWCLLTDRKLHNSTHIFFQRLHTDTNNMEFSCIACGEGWRPIHHFCFFLSCFLSISSKIKLFLQIYIYAVTWEKKLTVQLMKTLRKSPTCGFKGTICLAFFWAKKNTNADWRENKHDKYIKSSGMGQVTTSGTSCKTSFISALRVIIENNISLSWCNSRSLIAINSIFITSDTFSLLAIKHLCTIVILLAESIIAKGV